MASHLYPKGNHSGFAFNAESAFAVVLVNLSVSLAILRSCKYHSGRSHLGNNIFDVCPLAQQYFKFKKNKSKYFEADPLELDKNVYMEFNFNFNIF
jgi:hypothetical protein